MNFLIYYKIETECRNYEEGNYLLETIDSKPTYGELQEMFKRLREIYNTYHRAIIINMFELN